MLVSKPRFFIIDGHSQIYRAYYAQMAALTSATGEPTKAVYVFTKFLLALLTQHKPDFIALAVDGKREDLLRREISPTYKANRGGTPTDLISQVERIKQIAHALHIPVVQSQKYEADDIINTFVDWVSDLDIEVVIVSRDKDLHQLISASVTMYDPMADEWWDVDDVVEKWGVQPEQVLDIQKLMGDATDNIAGVPGIGEGYATKLIQEYGSIEGVLCNISKLKPSLRKKLQDACEDGAFTRSCDLVRLYEVDDISFDIDALEWQGLDLSDVKPIFDELGFKRWT